MDKYKLTTFCFGIWVKFEVAFRCEDGEEWLTEVKFLKDSEKIKQELLDLFKEGVDLGLIHSDDLEYYKNNMVWVVSID